MFETVEWKNDQVVLLDQTLLPHEEIYRNYKDPEEVAQAIEKMVVRGAPAIGVTAALGLALAAKKSEAMNLADAKESFEKWTERFAKTRPTAVNLFWAIREMKKVAQEESSDAKSWAAALLDKAQKIRKEDIDACKKMGTFGALLVKSKAKILTHCNAGALATAGWGTALGVIRSAASGGKDISVWVDETRPFLQGARLTAWELHKEKIPATLITDNMAGHIMAKGEVDMIVVGADRIAANGDVANKIGTYSLAVLAQENKVPFYVAAPLSTIDLDCPTGKDIPIEERDPEEVRSFHGSAVAPNDFPARHPAFDVTPSKFVTAIITDVGIAEKPYETTLHDLKNSK